MNKHLRKILVIVLILAGVIYSTDWWLGKYFFKTSENYPPELFDFHPIDFEFAANRPIYYYSDNKLYYDSLGKINLSKLPIWTGQIADKYDKHVYVSPNSEYIAVNVEDSKILILDKKGKILHEITPINKSFVEEDRHSGNYWGEELVWNENSTQLYFMQDKKWVSNYSEHNRTSLFSYSITNNQVNKVIDLNTECEGTFYLNHKGQKLYYEYADEKGDLPFKKIDLSKNTELESFYRNNNHKFEISSDSIFVNYNISHFGNFSYDYKHLITTVSGRNVESGLYYYSDSLIELIIKGKYGFGAFKGNHYSFLDNGEFLPGNRYFLGRLRANKYNGTIVIDVKTLKYMYFDKKIECFFSITNIDHPDFQRREYETSKQLIIEKIK